MTEEERQKLKISNVPLTVDIPSNFEFMAAAAGAGGIGGRMPSSKKGKPKRSVGRERSEMPFGLGTKKAAGKGQTMSFTYPNWERYLVKKVTD